jgi:uncharacterized protein YndB with AHSA1/START domain
MVRGMTVDVSAPVRASGSVEIAASPGTVWRILTAIDSWPAWNPDVTDARLEGPFAEGSTFSWKAGPGTITSTLVRVEEPRRLEWTGRTLGIAAVHAWSLREQAAGTVLTSEESWSGPVARLLRRRLQGTLDRATARGLGFLKAEAERAGRGETSHEPAGHE